MILLARHGRTAHNDEGRFQGRGNVPLDGEGRRQAAALAERVAGRGDVVRVVSSPLTRALETASFVAALTGLAPEVDPRLAETDTGDWTERTYDEVIAEDPEAYDAFRRLDLDFGAPGGERFGDQLARVQAAIADLRAQDPGDGAILVVAHGNVIRLLLRAERGEAPTHEALGNTHLEEL